MRKILAILILFLATPALADFAKNRNLYPLGEKEAFMANTGIALEGSTGSVYYNPAGLNTLSNGRISLSGNSYVNFKTDFDPLDRLDDTDISFTSSGSQAVPSTFVSARHFGAWVVAFSALVPEQTKIQDVALIETTNYNLDVSQTMQAQLLMLGLTAAHKFSDVNVGLSCFWTVDDSIANASVVLAPKGGGNTGVVNSYMSSKVQGLVCHAGMLIQVVKDWNFGAVIKSPFLQISGTGDNYYYQQAIDGTITMHRHMNVAANYRLPAELSIGTSYLFTADWMALLDLSLQFSTSYKRYESDAEETKINSVVRPNIGTSYAFTKKLKAYGGFAYNASAGQIVSAGDSKEDFRIFSLGGEWTEGQASMGLGLYLAKSNGKVRTSDERDGNVTTTATAIVLTSGFNF